MDKKGTKEKLKRLYEFIWKEDTLASWVVSLILIFLIVYFIFFPLLSLIMGSPMPLVVVESTSMHHPGGFIENTLGLESSFGQWWEGKKEWYIERNINYSRARGWPLRTGLEMGDIVAVVGANQLEIGDIIIFRANKRHPVIHRIIDIEKEDGRTIYQTKGDNNRDQIPTERKILKNQIIGKAIFRIPKVGWVKLGQVEIFKLIGLN